MTSPDLSYQATPQSAPADALLNEQIAYYRARANEYDEWFLRQGRYDHGAAENARWFAEAAQVADALDATLTRPAVGAPAAPSGAPTADPAQVPAGQPGSLSILELASGTGLWSARLQRHAARLTLVDSAPEMLTLARARIAQAQQAQAPAATGDHCIVEAIEADLFTWRPTQRYDLVFFGFWLSHIPPERFDAFWALVAECLAPGGQVFFVDSLYTEASTARDHQLAGPDASALTRRLNDGQEYRIVKVFYKPTALAARLTTLGWRANIQATPTYFVYGSAAPTLA